MDDTQQTIMDLAQKIPGYIGYQAKDRRRDADRVARQRLANQYNLERDHLARVLRDASQRKQYSQLVALDGASQQLNRFISRLQTAPTGYAGWFDAAQIQEADLDQIYQFDMSLAAGVDELREAITRVDSALKSNQGIDDTSTALRDEVDALNTRFEAREEFIARGKRPTPTASPLGALSAKPATAAGAVNPYEQLKLNDAVSYDKTDYLIGGRITYSVAAGKFYAYLLQDRDTKRWLRVGPNNELGVTDEIDFSVPEPLPASLSYNGKTYMQAEQGAANVTVEGASGTKVGAVNFTRYNTDGGGRFWVEDWGTEIKVQVGQVVDPFEVKLYRKL